MHVVQWRSICCLSCADERKAVVAHQANRGNDHLFKRVPPPGRRWLCDVCNSGLNGTTCYTCPTCPFDGGFDMCLNCSSPGSRYNSKPRHEHQMIAVLPDGLISQSHFSFVRPRYAGPACWCDSCGTEPVVGLVLSCVKCCNASSPCKKDGYDVCAKCADEDRGTYLHWRWSPKKEQHGTFRMLQGGIQLGVSYRSK